MYISLRYPRSQHSLFCTLSGASILDHEAGKVGILSNGEVVTPVAEDYLKLTSILKLGGSLREIIPSCIPKLEVLDDGVDGFVAAYANAKRLLPVGLSLTAPFAPVNEVQPVHFTVSCQ